MCPRSVKMALSCAMFEDRLQQQHAYCNQRVSDYPLVYLKHHTQQQPSDCTDGIFAVQAQR